MRYLLVWDCEIVYEGTKKQCMDYYNEHRFRWDIRLLRICEEKKLKGRR